MCVQTHDVHDVPKQALGVLAAHWLQHDPDMAQQLRLLCKAADCAVLAAVIGLASRYFMHPRDAMIDAFQWQRFPNLQRLAIDEAYVYNVHQVWPRQPSCGRLARRVPVEVLCLLCSTETREAIMGLGQACLKCAVT
jgi:hypothetical protein